MRARHLSFEYDDFNFVVAAIGARQAAVAAYCAATGRCAYCQAEIDVLGHAVEGNNDAWLDAVDAAGDLCCSAHSLRMDGARCLSEDEAALLHAAPASRRTA